LSRSRETARGGSSGMSMRRRVVQTTSRGGGVELLEECFEGGIAEGAGGVLQRLDAVEDEEQALLAQAAGDGIGLGVDGGGGRDVDVQPGEDLGEEGVGRKVWRPGAAPWL